MPWFYVDDQFHSHPKPRRAGLAAVGLWTIAGSHSMAYKTEGFVPDWLVVAWPHGKKIAGQLVTANLWSPAERDGETGWEFHDWEHFQQTADDIEATRAKARKRQQERRKRMREGVTDA